MNSKRKNRGPVRTQRNRSITAEGVYSNAHFMHTATSQVGNIVRLKTANGIVWEGVFKTFSSNFEVVLEVAARVSNPDNPNSSLLPSTMVDKLIFKARDIMHIVAKDVDLEYPTRDTFQTDTAISARLNGSNREEKELEPWDGELNGTDAPLELDSAANGWDANDMFRKNEQDYGVTSTFDHSLRGYTVPLQATDTADYKEAEAKANIIANEIENQPNHKARLELENGDEETLYAAVVRPNESNGKYIPPAKRKNQGTVKLARSTPPPMPGGNPVNQTPPGSSSTSSSSSISVNMHQAVPSPKGVVQTAPIAHAPNVVVANNVNVVHVPQQVLHMAPPPQNQIPLPVQGQMQQAQIQAPQVVQNQVPGHHQRHSHTPPHGYGGQQRQGGQQKGQHMNGDSKQMSRGPRNSYQPVPPPNVPIQTQQSPHPAAPYQGGEMPPKMADMNHNRHHRDEVKELQQFAQEFQLAPPQMGPKEVPAQQQAPPQCPPPQQMMEQQVVPQHIPPQQQQPMGKPPPQASPPQPSISPHQDGIDKMTNTLKKSTLNPNAKEFVLNPTAKPFQPRSPSTPSLSRPHTPQTPSHSPYISTAMNGPMGQPPTSVIMPMGYMMTSQPQYPQQPQGNRLRKIPMGQIRTDVASQMQVAAATGQPLLAPAPIQPFVYQPSLSSQYHQMHAVRMYDAPPQLQYLPPNHSQAGSPAQPPPYSQGQPQQPPPQQYQAAPPPQGGVQTHQYLPMCNLIPANPHLMQGMQYLPQAPPPQHPIPLILHNQQHQVHQGPA